MQALQRIQKALDTRNLSVERKGIKTLLVTDPGNTHRPYDIAVELLNGHTASMSIKLIESRQGSLEAVNSAWQIINRYNHDLPLIKVKANPKETHNEQLGAIGMSVDFYCSTEQDILIKQIDNCLQLIDTYFPEIQRKLVTEFEKIGLC